MICTEAYKEHIEYTFNAFCRNKNAVIGFFVPKIVYQRGHYLYLAQKHTKSTRNIHLMLLQNCYTRYNY